MTNLEFYRHKISYCMDLGKGMGIINGKPKVCGFGTCKSCIGFNTNDASDMACATEKIIDWMLAEHRGD